MKAVLAILLRVESGLAVIAYLVVAGLLLGEIIARELLATTIWGSQQMAVFAAIVAAFLGLSLATAANSHLRPQFADYWWPEAWHGALERIGDLISCLLYVGLGIITGLYIADTFINEDRAAVLYWPLWPFQIVIGYAFVSSAIRHLAFALWPGLKPAPAAGG